MVSQIAPPSTNETGQERGGAAHPLRRAMDGVYYACVVIAGSALVLISLVVPWGVYTRYVLESAASWPEPMAVLLSIVLTFFGAAACYRSGVHMRVTVARDLLPRLPQRIVDLTAEGLMALISLFMIVWGARLVEINVLLLVLGCLVDMAPSILITTPILLPVVMKFGVDPVHFGMIMLMNLGIGLCHPPVGATLFVGCAVGRVRMEDVMREIWPFYGVMFLVLMAVTYIPAISLWLPRALSL